MAPAPASTKSCGSGRFGSDSGSPAAGFTAPPQPWFKALVLRPSWF